jgi:hypothetical protein
MNGLGFSKHILRNNILRHGKTYTFKRNLKNSYDEELSNEYELITYPVKAIYHEVNKYIQVGEGESARVQSKKITMMVCLYEEAKDIIFNDKVELNGKLYKVNGTNDILEENEFIDISLEVM